MHIDSYCIILFRSYNYDTQATMIQNKEDNVSNTARVEVGVALCSIACMVFTFEGLFLWSELTTN